jgi:hypothetical protein
MTKFEISNYLLVPVSINFRLCKASEETPLTKIGPNAGKHFDLTSKIQSIFGEGSYLYIYIHPDPKNDDYKILYTSQYICCSGMKNLRIGMITTRVIDNDSLRQEIRPLAQGGRSSVKIHNKTSLPLYLNNNIQISPGRCLRYGGRYRYGVALGTIFRDESMACIEGVYPSEVKIYPTYQYLQPVTDIYYGIVSQYLQPINGNEQVYYNDNPSYGNAVFELQRGYFN